MGLKEMVIGYTSNYSDGIPYGVLSDVVTTTGRYSVPSLNTTLYRLSKEGRIVKTKDGNIKLVNAKEFSVSLDEEMVALYKRIKERFPFSNICMWNTDSIINLMHDVPGNDLCIINVEKERYRVTAKFADGTTLVNKDFYMDSFNEEDKNVYLYNCQGLYAG